MVNRKRTRTAVRSRKGREREMAYLTDSAGRDKYFIEESGLYSMGLQDGERNPHGTSYVDWIIAIVDHVIPEPPSSPISSLKKIA